MSNSNFNLSSETQLVCRLFSEFLSCNGLTYSLRVLEPEARIPKIPQSQISSVFSSSLQRQIMSNLGVACAFQRNTLTDKTTIGAKQARSRDTSPKSPKRRNSKDRQPMILQLLNFIKYHGHLSKTDIEEATKITEVEQNLRQREALLEKRKQDAEKWLHDQREAVSETLHEQRSQRLKELDKSRKLELMHRKQQQQRQVYYILS